MSRSPLRLALAAAALAALAALALPLPAAAAAVKVEGHRILVDGKPFTPRGVAGQQKLGLLPGLGVNTVRTYGDETGFVLDEAQRYGLKVIAGFWLEQPRKGFDYKNLAQVGPQLQKLQAFVERFRNHPALLMWGIGNEVEADLADDSAVWPGIEDAAKLVRRLDPNHPTMAVLAETGKHKIARMMKLAPSIQVLGINSYGDALITLPERVREQGWKGPLLVTEMGPMGQWAAPKTPWGAPVEPTSTEKAALLSKYLTALMPRSQGQILFYWGQKQEVTPTWHSMLLPGGEWQQSAEVMANEWGGKTPNGNRAPRILLLRFPQGNDWPRGDTRRAEISVDDPDGDPLGVVWTVMAESTDRKTGGDAETVPQSFPQAIRDPGPRGAGIAGLEPGNYRLFVTVRDGKGAAATGNLPFRIR
jgi:hypothetical protein